MEEDRLTGPGLGQLTNLEFLAAHALNGLVALAPERAEAFLEPDELEVCQPGPAGQPRACAAVFGRAAARLAMATLEACSELTGSDDRDEGVHPIGVLRSVWSAADGK